MKNLNYLLVLTLFSFITSYSQVGIGTTTPKVSSMLDIESTDSGILIPRMTETQKTGIVAPATGLLIYQTDATAGFWYFNGTIWTTFGGAGADNDWTVVGNDMYNANTGNVGVGNTAPSAKFHITGTTVSSSVSTTLYSNDFSSGSLSTTINAGDNGVCVSIPNIWHITASPTFDNCTTCTDERAYIYYAFCDQDQTVTEGTFTPTTTSVDISFNYGYRHYGSSQFIATLYNETSMVTTPLLTTGASDSDILYTGTHTVIAGDSYSLKFRYIGSGDYDASFDNILVSEVGASSGSSYMFRLEDGQQQDGYVLTSDANGNATWKVASGGGGGSGTYSFTNGLNEAAGTAKLGGALIEDTSIDLSSFDLTINGNSTGYFELQGNNRRIMRTNPIDDYVNFGAGSTILLGNDNTTFRDTGNNLFTVDFVAGFYAGDSGGSAIEVGSIEYILDGNAEFFFSNTVSPFTSNSLDLGADAVINTNDRYWQDVYSTNFVAVGGGVTIYNKTSGKSKHKMKGLSEIMKLNPFVYKEAPVKIGSRMSTTEEDDISIGFNAKELLEVIPEAVKTSDWYTVKEGEDMVKMNIENPNGIIYNRIIPVTVKAIQEQQVQIETLKTAVEELKKQNILLMKLLKNK